MMLCRWQGSSSRTKSHPKPEELVGKNLTSSGICGSRAGGARTCSADWLRSTRRPPKPPMRAGRRARHAGGTVLRHPARGGDRTKRSARRCSRAWRSSGRRKSCRGSVRQSGCSRQWNNKQTGACHSCTGFSFRDYLNYRFRDCSIFAQVSFSVTVRLKTGLVGA